MDKQIDKIKKSISLKIILAIAVLFLIVTVVSISFDLMNSASYLNLILGIVLMAAALGVPLEMFINHLKKTKK
jgi:hypothetical protein